MLKNHVQSACHRAAVDTIITLPGTTTDIGEQLSQQHQREKEQNRKMLMKIVSSLKYLARQGLPIRGDGNEIDSNFTQLLKLKGEDDPSILDWLERKANKYTSPEVQNDLLKVMGTLVRRKISDSLQQSPFVSIMLDETTDISNRQQATVVIRRIDGNLEVFEEFFGLSPVPSADANTLTGLTKDALCLAGLPLSKLRGQCYDGAASMKGARTGVAKQISDEEPRAIYMHCYGHSINLAVNDAIKQSKQVKSALEVTHEITKLIKYSPRREVIFSRLKSVHDITAHAITPGLRVLCPTRWTVCADALTSILDNYEVLMSTWEESLEVLKDTETKARVIGVATQMKKFDFFFGVVLGQLILGHSDNLSKTLQKKSFSAAEGQEVARMVIRTLENIRTEQSFELFWAKVVQLADSLNVEEAELPRRRKQPARFEDGMASGYYHSAPQDLFRQVYYEAVDNTVQCLKTRFDQPGYQMYCNLEQLLIKASMNNDFEQNCKVICTFYKDDFNPEHLRLQLRTFGTNFQSYHDSSDSPTVFEIKKYIKNLTQAQRDLLDQVVTILKLILIMPATNATSERSFSALRRVKTYLRSTMGQDRLNDLMLLHVHKDITDNLNVKEVINCYVKDSEHRLRIFGKFHEL